MATQISYLELIASNGISPMGPPILSSCLHRFPPTTNGNKILLLSNVPSTDLIKGYHKEPLVHPALPPVRYARLCLLGRLITRLAVQIDHVHA